MLVIQSKKTDYDTKITETETKLTGHNHNKDITTPEFNKLTTENFAARLAHANLITGTGFNAKLSSLNKKISSNKTKYLLVQNEFKSCKHLIQAILLAKVILKKMVHKIIQYFSQRIDILTELKVLVLVIIFILGDLKDWLIKILQLLLQSITNSIQN